MPSSIIAGRPAPGLAERLGDAVVRERGGVRHRELRARSLVGRCDSPRMPFRWTVNPYRGCAMGCRYCYATYTHEYLGLSATDDFHSTVFVKTGGEAETFRALVLAAARGELVALGTATDPYQPGEAQFGATRRFLEMAVQVRGLRLSVATKGALVLRDLDLLARIARHGQVRVRVSLVSPDADLLRRLEPWAPPPAVRLSMLRGLAEAGIDAGLLLAPVLPGLTDRRADLETLLAATRDAGVRHVTWNVLFLRSPTREFLLAWLDRERPRLAAAYRRAYSGGRAYAPAAYRARLDASLNRLAQRCGLTPTPEAAELAEAVQLALELPAAGTAATGSPAAAAARS